ncbi:hypothetical protein [Streptomyces sp. NPDC058985]|uniref:hypothetical protein n=1 Tax=Streptomyces sp. NPDC058985 TaxID=3346684 RepID=UPI00368EDD5B
MRLLFEGDDARRWVFDAGVFPLPGWQRALADGFAERTGPAGGLRTLASARSAWESHSRWMSFLAALPQPPQQPGELSLGHVEAFQAQTEGTYRASQDVSAIRMLLATKALRPVVDEQVAVALQRRPVRPQWGVAGYSNGEFERLIAAARADTARVRDRIRAGQRLADQAAADWADAQGLGGRLAGVRASGVVPDLGGGVHVVGPRWQLARHLFVVTADLAPLLVLLTALSERNGETVKELPAEHRVLDGRAVEVRGIKRRRGSGRWEETFTWEIGPPGRELHTPGGCYLLLHELMAASRAACGSDRLFCIWSNGSRRGASGLQEHIAPFVRNLDGSYLGLSAWAAGRAKPLMADPVGGQEPGPLRVSFNRIKTSAEVRRTRRLGGHLPSAAKSNTMQVLFRNYLGKDPVIVDWSEDILGQAFVDAERAAVQAHQQLVALRGHPRVLPGPVSEEGLAVGAGLDDESARRVAGGELDTAWSACGDPGRHPATGGECRVSFLDCFHCGNCLITRSHLPRLLSLLDALVQRRQQMSEAEWWHRYGPTWAAIRHDVLAKFSPAELARAEADKTGDALLDLVEEPWETP